MPEKSHAIRTSFQGQDQPAPVRRSSHALWRKLLASRLFRPQSLSGTPLSVRLWEFENPFSVPINISGGESVGTFPDVAKLPEHIVVQKDIDRFSFKKAVKLYVAPEKFVSDEKGLLVQTRVSVADVK